MDVALLELIRIYNELPSVKQKRALEFFRGLVVIQSPEVIEAILKQPVSVVPECCRKAALVRVPPG